MRISRCQKGSFLIPLYGVQPAVLSVESSENLPNAGDRKIQLLSCSTLQLLRLMQPRPQPGLSQGIKFTEMPKEKNDTKKIFEIEL